MHGLKYYFKTRNSFTIYVFVAAGKIVKKYEHHPYLCIVSMFLSFRRADVNLTHLLLFYSISCSPLLHQLACLFSTSLHSIYGLPRDRYPLYSSQSLLISITRFVLVSFIVASPILFQRCCSFHCTLVLTHSFLL